MSVSSFKFVSPGVFVKEFDNSQITATPAGVGPTIIGRLERGPAMRPVRIGSMSQFVEIFGNPVAGRVSNDAWRNGNYSAPTYAAYAIQAWLRNTPSVNVVRLLGTQHTSATTDGKAGWNLAAPAASAGGAYGLFLVNSGSTNLTGTLAAVWYLATGSIALSGTLAGGLTTDTAQGSNALFKSDDVNGEFKAVVFDGSGAQTFKTSFNFNTDSNKYVRDVFNTNPVLTNTTITPTANQKTYWLGETFDRSVAEYVTSLTGSGAVYGFVAPLTNGTQHGGNYRTGMQKSKTGFVFGQDLGFNNATYNPANMPQLFRFVTIDSGEWESKNLKISIVDVKGPRNPQFEEYGTFSVEIRRAEDLDVVPKVVERFTNLNLNPASENYIARRIGDRFIEWNDSEKRYREFGNYPNLSKYVYVEMNAQVDNGTADQQLVPFGFIGPSRFKKVQVLGTGSLNYANTFVSSSGAQNLATAGNFLKITGSISSSFDAQFLFPAPALRVSAAAEGLSDLTKAYFGYDVTTKATKTQTDKSYVDYVRLATADYSVDSAPSGSNREFSFYFTLDDLSGSSNGAVYVSGSRVLGTSITATGASSSYGSIFTSASYEAVLNAGYNRFTMPLVGGFDGVDVTEADPFRNSIFNNITPTETTNYEYYTLRRAVDTVADPETIVTDIISVPGITYAGVTDHVITTAENRADCMAIIDLPNVYTPDHEAANVTTQNRLGGGVDQVVNTLKGRAINSSYAATYYPWVQIRDTINNQNVWVPPSVVAIGALSYGQATQELWFAPAGFTRGGLSEGRGGVPVLAVSQRLNSRERDLLYEANINPIAQFPAEGIVIFGQKTLQVTPSALDRINVRRLMIYLKREISIIASRLLFDQNVSSTWGRFKSQVEPFLDSVKTRLGVTEYRLVLDSTTTTPDLIDRNILYARIYLKPARAIEFIAIDFNISSSGASFAD
jgi:phage tail sheath protein FI